MIFFPFLNRIFSLYSFYVIKDSNVSIYLVLFRYFHKNEEIGEDVAPRIRAGWMKLKSA